MHKIFKTSVISSLIILNLINLQGCAPLVLASAAGGVAVLTDRRTTGTYIEDKAIELKALKQLNDNKIIADRSHVSVISYNERVLITGQAANDNIKNQIEDIVKKIPKVKTVYNEVQTTSKSSLKKSSYDTWLSTKVKANLTANLQVNPLDIKVTTDDSTVYLMGIVTPHEADIATNIVRKVGGVGKVVKLFEYVDAVPGASDNNSDTQMAKSYPVSSNDHYS